MSGLEGKSGLSLRWLELHEQSFKHVLCARLLYFGL